MQRIRRIIALLSILLLSTVAFGNVNFINPHAGVQLGVWEGNFSQSGFGMTTRHITPINPGLEFQFGLLFSGLVFLEYNITFFQPYGPRIDKAEYQSYFGGNLGFEIPILPIEIYYGQESGGYSFPGTSTSFSGTAYKLGIGLTLFRHNSEVVRIRGEFRRLFMNSDQAGDLPSAYHTQSDIYFVGISFGISPTRSK